jgi:membrane-bound lytic murein transglycosylase D
VPMILAAIVIARNPAQYGFELQAEPLVPYDTVTLPRPVDLRRVAEWTDTTIDQIQALNPELRRWTTPVRDEAYELKVPAGTATVVNTQLEEAAALELASLKWYTVKKGETLATVARKLGVGRTDLAEANYLKINERIAAGQKLMVPHESTVLLGARTDRPVPVADSRTLAAVDAVVPAVDSGPTERVKVLYEVKRGDTLASIARVFRTSVSALQTWNGIDGTRILAGDRLTIYTARSN